MENDAHEKFVGQLYDDYWSLFYQWYNIDETLGIHLGFYEGGIKNQREAILNMNDFIGKLLGLEKKISSKILDAGCGVGGTSIYLAKKFPNVSFIGITIAPEELKLAKKFSKERNVCRNTRFILKNFVKTDFSNNYFDGAFAIESSTYAENHNDFVDEMHRILKPSGKLVIIDVFRTEIPTNSIMQKIFKDFCKGYGNINPPSIESHKLYLKEKGFKDIDSRDISKNASPALAREFILALPFFTSKLIKRAFNFLFWKSSIDTIREPRGVTVLAVILGLAGAIRYYAISAVKI